MQSRSKKSALNIITVFINKFLSLIIKFVVRTFFIYYLGVEYLGINGLFLSIIALLSLADLGFSIALPQSLYKPLAEKNTKKISALMQFYSRIYSFIGTSVLLIGLIIVPFLPYIIKDNTSVESINLIFILFVINASISYFFSYKRSLIIADQKGYIISTIEWIFSMVLGILQIIILIIFKDFILYLLAAIAITLAQNIYISLKCNQMYPFIKDKEKNTLESNELKKLTKNIFALFIYKVAMAVETSIDNIVISIFLGITLVGIYSNYSLIILSLQGILMVAINSLTASIGNLIIKEGKEKVYNVFSAINLFSSWLYGLLSVIILILVNPFILLWVGEDFVLSIEVLIVLSINLYVFGSHNTTSAFRNAYGLFWEARFRPVLMVFLNIVLSILLVQVLGLIGVFIASLISRLVTVGIMDPYIVHKYGFEKNVLPYHMKKIKYFMKIALSATLTIILTYWIADESFFNLAIKALVIFITMNVILLLIFRRTEEFKYIKDLSTNLVKKII